MTDIERMIVAVGHKVNGQYCETCGQDSATCQKCGRRVCGYGVSWIDGTGNVCAGCLRRG